MKTTCPHCKSSKMSNLFNTYDSYGLYKGLKCDDCKTEYASYSHGLCKLERYQYEGDLPDWMIEEEEKEFHERAIRCGYIKQETLTETQITAGISQARRIVNTSAGYYFGGELFPFDPTFKKLAIDALDIVQPRIQP